MPRNGAFSKNPHSETSSVCLTIRFRTSIQWSNERLTVRGILFRLRTVCSSRTRRYTAPPLFETGTTCVYARVQIQQSDTSYPFKYPSMPASYEKVMNFLHPWATFHGLLRGRQHRLIVMQPADPLLIFARSASERCPWGSIDTTPVAHPDAARGHEKTSPHVFDFILR